MVVKGIAHTNAIFMLSSFVVVFIDAVLKALLLCAELLLLFICYVFSFRYFVRSFIRSVLFFFIHASFIFTFCGLNESESFKALCECICLFVFVLCLDKAN